MSEDDTHPKLAQEDPLEDSLDDSDEKVLEVLLTDYEAAAEDARYRDQFLHYTYYLVILVLSFITSAGWTVYTDAQRQIWLLAPFGLVGVFILLILLFWAESFRGARNSSWARRDEIEAYLNSIQPGILQSNSSVPNRLTFNYEYGRKSWFADRQVAAYIRYFLLLMITVLMAITIIGLGATILRFI